ncbi:MAG: XTP/dITP diphosphatase [Anaeroplasmataceae bacterium]|nr:XTP/dITP diphosphatase [Anaeroplasmataceae bacterium]
MKKIVVATRNLGKLKEFQNLFPEDEVLSLADIGYEKEIEEDGSTFEENAIKKASQVSKDLNLIVIADDSGLEVEALGGAPGIHSARFASDHDPRSNNEKLIELLKNETNRNARFVCVICLCYPNGKTILSKGICNGTITYEAKGNRGFGYDPYFYVKEYGQTMAEMPLEVKNQISHRAKAIQKLKEMLYEDISSF